MGENTVVSGSVRAKMSPTLSWFEVGKEKMKRSVTQKEQQKTSEEKGKRAKTKKEKKKKRNDK